MRGHGTAGEGEMASRGSGFKKLQGRFAMQWLAVLLVAGAYVGASRVSFALTVPFHGNGEPALWIASGIALAAVVLGGWRMLPGVALGALVAGLIASRPLGVALAQTVGVCLEAGIGAALLRHFRIDTDVTRIGDVAGLFVFAAASCGLSATVGVASIAMAGGLHENAFVLWRVWWLGDLVGVVVVGAAILVFAAQRLRRDEARRAVQAVMLAVVMAAAIIALAPSNSPFVYMAVPVTLMMAVRYRQRGAVLGCLVVSAVSMTVLSRGHGAFVGGPADTQMLRAQLFLVVAAFTALLTAAARSERDVAECALEKLADSERALADAQRLANLGSFEWDRHTGRMTASDQLHRIFGRDPDDDPPLSEMWRSHIHPDDLAYVDSVASTVFADRSPYSIVHRIVRPDGTVRTVEAHGRLEFDENGQPLRLLGAVVDITALKASEDLFRSMLETAPDAIVIADETGRIVLVNSQTERLFGRSRTALIGRPVERLVPIDLVGAVAGLDAAGSADASALALGSGLDVFATHRDGREFPVEISLSPLETADGTLILAAIRDVTERKQAADALSHQATHDPLTGLPNRTLFLDRLDHALLRAQRSRSKLAVLFLDLDDFKLVNDTLGHDAGDQLLVSLTPRLTAALRPGDTVARFGGDEFVVLCEDLTADGVALDIADRIAKACARPLMIADTEHVVTLSAGAVIVNDGAAAPVDVLRDADAAMYRAKALGKGRVEIFDEGMRARLLERMDTESELRRAIKLRQLRLHYQPIVSLDCDDIVGFEALLRWQHPTRGLLEPSDFMPIAESTGLIVELGEWVIAHACREAAIWQRARPADRPLWVSVNLSPRQVSRSDIAGTVAGVLARTGLDPHLLHLEITETALLDDSDAARRALGYLKRLGVRIVLDDFGTGYSSLSNLRRFTIDALKIDRSFIDGLERDAEDGAIVNAVLGMARALDVAVTAEGVETSGQIARLREQGCAFAQGYLFSRPVPPSELPELIALRPGAPEQLLSLIGPSARLS